MWSEPVANSASGNVSLVWQSHASGDIFGVGRTNVAYNFIDGYGQVAHCRFSVTGTSVDTRPPEVSLCPRNQTAEIELGNNSTTCDWIEPVAFDVLGGIETIRSHTPGAEFPLGLTRVYYQFTDGSGNNSTCEFYINVIEVDTTPPTVHNCPSNIFDQRELDGPLPSVTWEDPTASDLSGHVTVTSSHTPGIFFQVNTTVVTYTFEDAAHNTATCRFEVNVWEVDTRPPRIDNCPANITNSVELGSSGTSIQWTEPNASDPSNVVNRLLRTHKPGDTFISGTHVVTYLYVDASRNMAKCEFGIRINTEDTKPPVIFQCPSDIERIATSHTAGTIVTWSEPTATDYSNYTYTQTHTPGSMFPIGVTRVNYAFIDGSVTNNRAECVFTITIVPVNTTFIELTSCPKDITYTVELGTVNKAVTWIEPVAYDPHGDVTLVLQSHHSGQAFEVGKHAVTYEFTNEAGHVVVCNFTVVIASVDTTPPTVLGCPSDITTEIEKGTWGKSVTWIEPTATDISGKVTLLSRTHVPGSLFYPGQSLVTYIYTDPSHNLAACSFNINTVSVDTSPPQVTSCPYNITNTVQGNDTSAKIYWKTPEAFDLSGDELAIIASYNPGDEFSVGTTKVVYKFADSAQNSAACSFTVTIATVTIETDAISSAEFNNCPKVIDSTPLKSEQECQATWDEPKASDGTQLLFQTHAPGVTVPSGTSIMVTYVFKKNSHLAPCTFTVKCSKVELSKQTQQKAESPLSIAGIVTAAVIGICLLIALLLVCFRRRYRNIKHLKFTDDLASPTFTEAPFVLDDKGMTSRPENDTGL
ncbi:hyalin-like [Amphiura filiformis]|uniref:hyalin-like n=1 Tax=Amphiura filiformis TaxID=82378 RepID=UPI003B211087